MYYISIIGAGQIGSRHLQGLAKIDIPVTIFVIDPDTEALAIAKERFKQIPDTRHIKQIEFNTSINNLYTNIDLAIISTTANIREKVTKDLLMKRDVKNIVFEKIVFQSAKQFENIYQILQKYSINAWVNCPRRLYPFYIDLKKMLTENKKISYVLHGGEWGLACNSIHFIDQVSYLIEDYKFTIDVSHLDKDIIESKRKGFIELTGSLEGFYANGSKFVFYSQKGSQAPHKIFIQAENFQIMIDEIAGNAWIATQNNGWKWEGRKFYMPYQSELTNFIAKDILIKNNCGLPTFEESYLIHKPFLKALLKHITKYTGNRLKFCPIT